MAQLYFKYGAMGSSKTANALMTRFNYEERGQKTLLVKPRLDTRDGDHMVVSRIGQGRSFRGEPCCHLCSYTSGSLHSGWQED